MIKFYSHKYWSTVYVVGDLCIGVYALCVYIQLRNLCITSLESSSEKVLGSLTFDSQETDSIHMAM